MWSGDGTDVASINKNLQPADDVWLPLARADLDHSVIGSGSFRIINYLVPFVVEKPFGVVDAQAYILYRTDDSSNDAPATVEL